MRPDWAFLESLAGVGLTEEQARAKYGDLDVKLQYLRFAKPKG